MKKFFFKRKFAMKMKTLLIVSTLAHNLVKFSIMTKSIFKRKKLWSELNIQHFL